MAEQSGMIGLADSLLKLRSELTSVAGSDPKSELAFLVEDVALEMTIVASNNASAGGGVKWLVFSADASMEVSTAATQKLTLRLKVVERETGGVAKINSVDAQRD